ncbi:MAG: hypothetical protein ACE5E4_00275 [Candidatus Binatia bacterium]
MDFDFGAMLGGMGQQFEGLFNAFVEEGEDSGFSSLLAPVAPFNSSGVLTPLVSVAGCISIIMLSGVAVGALATLLASLLAVYFLLTEVFGYNIALAVPEP